MNFVNLSRPRIGLNAHLFNLSGNYRSAGINWYIYHLIKHLVSLPEFDYTLFLSDERASAHFGRACLSQSRLPTHHPIVRIFWEQFIQPFALRQTGIDLLHALAFAGPLVLSIPWIVTIYDLSFIHFPQAFNAANRIYLNWAIRDSLRRADRVIAISENTRHDLVSIFGAPKERVQVVYCGTDASFTSASSIRPPRAPEKMILFVGTIEPRKNVAHLIRSFARAKRKAKFPHKLVLIGARGWKYDEVDQVIAKDEIGSDVIFTGYVPQAELPDWYRAADLFVYPSLCEGFGLPPLEAMACGIPVITSSASSLPEVAGDAAIMVSPRDENELADAIVRVLDDGTLREQMIGCGFRQAAKFSWARAATETSAIYREVLGANHATA